MKTPRTPTRTVRRPAVATTPQSSRRGSAFGGPRRLIDAEFIIGGGLNAKVFNLLAAIEREGSIVHAAKAAGLSYRGAWDMIERASDLSPRPLIAKVIGGGEEKGTRLTETGQSLLAAYRRLQEEKVQFLDRLNAEFGHNPIILQWFKRIFMKSSARNQWSGTVTSVKLGAVNAEVIINLKGGATLVASITQESAKSMGLEFGQTVIALVKAPMIMVLTDAEGYRLSARNQMSGQISHLQPGPVNTEVTIGLETGDSVVATVTRESAETLGLEIGKPALAVFKASAVILAVPL
ncbi:MAG: TOBE domain-containing protein [Methylococcaceae bacterium]|nr:TOBE domain-containing protein [Methylococcaceae bacterium]